MPCNCVIQVGNGPATTPSLVRQPYPRPDAIVRVDAIELRPHLVSMHFYDIYGGRLESEAEIPELRPGAPGTADWRLRIAQTAAPIDAAVAVGEEQLLPDVFARLVRAKDRFRLSFDDTGIFDVSLDGRTISWTPAPGADPELARVDLIGRVLSLAIHAGGDACLHASSVSIGGQAIAFLAPKGYGKSTLAISMVGGGAQLLTDDTLRLRLGDPPIAVPGMYSIRLRDDSAKFAQRPTSAEFDGKHLIDTWGDRELCPGEAPLVALYLLAPVAPSAERAAVVRRQLSPMHAMLGVAQQGKISALLGKTEGGVVARRIGALAAKVPVYRLEVSRSLDRLTDVVAQLHQWHHAAAEVSTAGAA